MPHRVEFPPPSREESHECSVEVTAQGPIRLGRPAAAERAADRGRAHGARRRARLLPGQARAARAGGVPPREDRSGDLSRDGRARPARADDPRAIRRAGPELRQLRPDRARGGARGLGLPLDDERAVFAGDGADLRIRFFRTTKQKYLPKLASRRMDRLLRPHRAEPRLRPGLDGDAREEGRRRLQPDRQQDVDLQLADRRRVRRLGEGRRRRDPGFRTGQRIRRACPPRRSTARSACAPPSPAKSSWTACSARRRTPFPKCAA